MSFSRLKLQSHRDVDQQTFNPDKPPMSLPRVFFTALSLLFAVFMYYIAMHYVPALAGPSKTIRFADDFITAPSNLDEFEFEELSSFKKSLGSYSGLFGIDRNYMRSGESIKIKYEIPEGTTVHLDIIQCRRVLVIEVFKCDPVNKFSTQKNISRGITVYDLSGRGFYHFRHRVEGLEETDSYRLVWERVIKKP